LRIPPSLYFWFVSTIWCGPSTANCLVPPSMAYMKLSYNIFLFTLITLRERTLVIVTSLCVVANLCRFEFCLKCWKISWSKQKRKNERSILLTVTTLLWYPQRRF
jgi:hypothetical protein